MAQTAKKRKVKMPGSIRHRLTAALCMLLVSSIMLVSSSYAWFTLSTAPEVKSIDTTVAGNGSLEIALMPATGVLGDIGSGRSATGYDGNVPITTANNTWGNVVNLSDASYGLANVSLNPAVLNLNEDGAFANPANLLSIAKYGFDGRVEKLDSATITNKSWDATASKFTGTGYGVRAIGETATVPAPTDTDPDATEETFNTFGYIIDLAVRLNTTKDDGTLGKLLLQTDEAQRVYADSANEATMGGGSYMSFDDNLTGLNMADLMKAIRVTFVQDLGTSTGTPTILGTAKLDWENAEAGSAKLYLVKTETTTPADGSDPVTTETLVTTQADAVLIPALTKNAAAQISAVVWLDGNAVKNSSVSSINTALAQATLNIQFATDVELHPAANAPLHAGE